jgi:hypothetical protein
MTTGRILKVAAVASLAAVLAWVLLGKNGKPAAKPPSQTSPASTAGTTAAATPTPGKSGNRPKPVTRSATATAAADLEERVSGFLQSYYLIKPEDTAASRRSRVAPYVLPGLLKDLDVGLSSGTTADQARIRQRLTQRGTPTPSKLEAGKASGEKDVRVVSVPVVITLTRPDGQQVSKYVLNVSSRWQFKNDSWDLISFDKGGGDSG